MAQATKQSANNSDTTATVITILALFFVPLIGIILMWAWTKWAKSVKIIITVIFGLFTLLTIFIFIAIFASINPQAQIENGQRVRQLNECYQSGNDVNYCLQKFSPTISIPANALPTTK